MSAKPGDTRLKDQDLQPVTVVNEADLASGNRLPAGSWVVVLNEQAAPVAALAPESVPGAAADAADSPPFIVADAELDLNAALRSPAFEMIGPDTGVVLREGDTIVGVWSGPSLIRAVMSGPSRMTGPVLPGGGPKIPAIVRRCKYTDGGRSCGTVTTFSIRPPTPATCGNVHHMTQHAFVW